MSDTQALLGGMAGVAVAVVLLAGWREARRKRRDDPDAVGWVDWPTVQVLALIALAVVGLLALRT